MNPLYEKKRLELIVEKSAIRRTRRILEESGLKGFTILPALAGFGNSHYWERDTDISSTTDMVMFVSIGDDQAVTAALENLHNLLDHHIGLLNVSTVEVMRPDRF